MYDGTVGDKVRGRRVWYGREDDAGYLQWLKKGCRLL